MSTTIRSISSMRSGATSPLRNVWRGLHGQTNHRNFDFFGAGSVQLEAQIMFPPSMSEIPIAGPYPELRPFLPFAPSDGAVRSLVAAWASKDNATRRRAKYFVNALSAKANSFFEHRVYWRGCAQPSRSRPSTLKNVERSVLVPIHHKTAFASVNAFSQRLGNVLA